MGRTDEDAPREAEAVSVGDGSLGGPAIGGSVTGPDAGVIRDPVGAELAAPVITTPDEPEQAGAVKDDLQSDTERPSPG
jgi:hypothetical protein